MKNSKLYNLSGSGMRDFSHTETYGKWDIEANQDGEWNNSRYSKGWHRQHGGVFEISERTLTFSRKHGRGKLTKKVYLDSWSGDFVAHAVLKLELEPKNPKLPLKIRLSKAYDAKKLYRKRGYTFYSRILLGEHIDYAIKSPLGMIYHDADRNNLIKGLHNKIRNASRKLKGVINWNKCKKLGFCTEGLNNFCDVFSINVSGDYTMPELESIVRKNPSGAEPFMLELKTVANSFNYYIAEFN